MNALSRRSLLKGLGATAGAMALSTAGAQQASARTTKVIKGTDLITLGKSGVKATVLGIGTGTVGGSQQRALGTEGFTRLFRHAYDRGIRYIDTADMYMMHVFLQIAMRGLPRDQFCILTKTRAKSAEVARADLDRFRRELRTDYLDCVLMHCMVSGDWPQTMRPVLDVLLEAKEKGIVRAVGVSCHGFPPLEASVGCDELDVQLVRINPFGDKMDGPPEKVAEQIRKMHAKGRGVLGMKIYGETGYDSREKRLQSIKYVLGLGCVHCFTIGFTAPEQIDETLELIEQASKELAAG